jgi:large subunit ribosomal protein L15
MPLHRRIPKRGFTSLFRKKWLTVTLVALERCFDAGAKVTEESLRSAGLIKGRGHGVKILGTGEITKALEIHVEKVTEGAKKKIEAAGGRCEVPAA